MTRENSFLPTNTATLPAYSTIVPQPISQVPWVTTRHDTNWAALVSDYTDGLFLRNIGFTPEDQDVIHRSDPGVDSAHSHRFKAQLARRMRRRGSRVRCMRWLGKTWLLSRTQRFPSAQAAGRLGRKLSTVLANSLMSSSSPLNGPPRSNFREAVIAANFPTSSSLVLLSL